MAVRTLKRRPLRTGGRELARSLTRARGGIPGRIDIGQIRDTPLGTLFTEDEVMRQWAAQHPGVKEIVDWDYYSFKAYPLAGQTLLSMFNQTAGSAANGFSDTNLRNPNQLPADQVFIIRSIRVVYKIGASVTANQEFQAGAKDFMRVLGNGSLSLIVSHKIQHQDAPLWAFPSGVGPYGPAWAAVTDLEAAAQPIRVGQIPVNALPPTYLDPVIGIPPQHHFEVELRWNAVQTVAVIGRIGVILCGWLMRSVQ